MNYTKTSVSSVRNLWLAAATTLTLSACGSPELQTTEPVNPSFFQSESMPACHTALASFDGTTAYSNGDNTAFFSNLSIIIIPNMFTIF